MIDDDGATTAVLVLTIGPTWDGAVALRWSGPQDNGTDNEVGCRIEVSADGGWSIPRIDTATRQTEYTDPALVPGQTRHF